MTPDLSKAKTSPSSSRLHWRIKKIVQSGNWPPTLALHTQWRRVDQGGLEDIEAWIKSVKEPRLICVDTLAKIRPAGLSRDKHFQRIKQRLRIVLTLINGRRRGAAFEQDVD